MKIFIKVLSILAMFLFSTVSYSQQASNSECNKVKTCEYEKYVGEYTIDNGGEEQIRKIVLQEEKLYYVVNDETQIPLKPESKTKFNLYPSRTYVHFIFNENDEVTKITIEKGSGDKISGVKTK